MDNITEIARRLPPVRDIETGKIEVMPRRPKATVPPPVRIVDANVCPLCKGTGFLRYEVPKDHPVYGASPWNHPLFGKTKPCQCQARASARRSLSRTYTWLGAGADVVSELEAMTFATFDPRANGEHVALAYKRARGYAETLKAQVEGQKNGLFIGPLGVGKTHLACAVLNTVRMAGIGCLFASGNELFQALYDRDFDERILRQATETPLLCLDDLDKMQVREDGSYQKSTLFTLLNARYVAKKPTIITANADDDWKQWMH